MLPVAPVPPASDRALGLEFYVTKTPGAPIVIKADPEDFAVREISAYPMPDELGRFTVLRIESRNWEQHELVQRLGRQLNVPPRLIRWAGTKDRRAVAERLFSYPGPLPSSEWTVPGVRLLEAYRAREGLVLGQLYGNAFEIRLGLSADARDSDAVRNTLAALRELSGFANLFGPQRFGEVRPVTHLVGQALVQGDVPRAVALYLEYIPPGAPSMGDDARRAYASHHDPVRALREFPAPFRFERSMLDHLAQGHSEVRAFRALPHALRVLFVHAYQAWLFNRWVSGRVQAGLPFDRPVVGDVLLRVGRDGTVPGNDPVPTQTDNLSECSSWTASGRARVAGPLVGTDTPQSSDLPGRLLDDLLQRDGVGRAAFAMPATPELASQGTWRPVWCPLPPVGVRASQSTGGGPTVTLSFALPKGVYATVLLREISKGEGISGSAEGPSNRVY